MLITTPNPMETEPSASAAESRRSGVDGARAQKDDAGRHGSEGSAAKAAPPAHMVGSATQRPLHLRAAVAEGAVAVGSQQSTRET